MRTDGERAEVVTADGRTIAARQVFANVAPAVLRPAARRGAVRTGARRAPRSRSTCCWPACLGCATGTCGPERAFAGTFHVNEGYAQLETGLPPGGRRADPDGRRRARSTATRWPTRRSCRPELQAAGAQTLTLFALHMPARLFRDDPVRRAGARRRASVLASLDSVLAEPIEECLLDPDCIEVMGPLEIEAELGMPGGHIFHRDLQWPFAESSRRRGPLGRRDRARQRLRLRRRRPPRRRRLRHPRPQRGDGRPRRLTLVDVADQVSRGRSASAAAVRWVVPRGRVARARRPGGRRTWSCRRRRSA